MTRTIPELERRPASLFAIVHVWVRAHGTAYAILVYGSLGVLCFAALPAVPGMPFAIASTALIFGGQELIGGVIRWQYRRWLRREIQRAVAEGAMRVNEITRNIPQSIPASDVRRELEWLRKGGRVRPS